LRTDPDAVVEDVHPAAGKAAHGKSAERTAGIAGKHADRTDRGLACGAVALLAHGLLAHHFDGGRRFMHAETEMAGAACDRVAVERCRRFGFRHWFGGGVSRGAFGVLRCALLIAALAACSLFRRRHHDGTKRR
jgi:hypothetical protein